MGPSRRYSVAVAIAASVIYGSATSRTGARQRRWSHTKTPVPADLLGLGGQTRDHRRVGKTVEDRQPERRAQSGTVGVLI
jgi:hypothetical protein